MGRQVVFSILFLTILSGLCLSAELKINDSGDGYDIEVVLDDKVKLSSPVEGLWSIGIGWKEGWPQKWVHAKVQKVTTSGPWTIVSGQTELSGGKLLLRDAYRDNKGVIECVRRFQWQGMDNFANAIETARKNKKFDTHAWEEFLKKACDVHAGRILRDDWKPRSTAEGFFISPLCKGYQLFGKSEYKQAALKATEHYGARHINMDEPYWEGTLDASSEDKEGAWAAFQGFLAAYEMTGDKKYLSWAEHACNVVLSYVVVWDIEMPAGRLDDHSFNSRGWTMVSPQNQHVDVYGVLCAPAVYRTIGWGSC